MLNFGDGEVDFTVPEGLTEGRYVDILSGNTLDIDASTRLSVAGLGSNTSKAG